MSKKKSEKMTARDVLNTKKRCLGHYVDSNGNSRPCTKNAGHWGKCK